MENRYQTHTAEEIRHRLQNELLLLDGAMGTELQKSGLPLGTLPELWNLTHPETVTGIHRAYEKAGAQILYTNTFGANEQKLSSCGYSVEEVITAAVKNAQRAAGKSSLIALDIGPTGSLLEPAGTLPFEEAVGLFRRQAEAGISAGADLVVLETMSDLYEIKAGILAVREAACACGRSVPILASMSFEKGGRSVTGCCVSAMGLTLEGLGVDALGFNCSCGPTALFPLAKELCRWTQLPILLKPNAGLPDPETNRYQLNSTDFAQEMEAFLSLGIHIFGGCCGSDPSFIAALRTGLSGKPFSVSKENMGQAARSGAVCTPTTTVCFAQRLNIIGEGINPSGKPLIKQALQEENLEAILALGVRQADAGASILDVNLGLPGIDEAKLMRQSVQALQRILPTPLQIDSSEPAVLEAALRAYNGKAIVNSVGGDENSLGRILPIVKRYGAAVIGLTLDEQGIPPQAEGRVEIAQKILSRAAEYGIPKQDVIIDCLTLTAATQQKESSETLRALRLVKERLGVKTVLGISNISFGLPKRVLLNHSFLLLALEAGLDLAILDPTVPAMMDAVRAYEVLANRDDQLAAYLGAYSVGTGCVREQSAASCIKQSPEAALQAAVQLGRREGISALTLALLESHTPDQLIESLLIPALDQVGRRFESGELFLPQMLQAAQAAQVAFDCIKAYLAEKNPNALQTLSFAERGILLATVQGDIHDIGKNIVRVILENYGFPVLDLGRDISPTTIAEEAQRSGAKLIGLSALMTSTLGSMKASISAVREKGLSCKIMVGGAVLTPDYAKKIGADYYAKDAKQAVDIAKEVLLNPSAVLPVGNGVMNPHT